MGKRVLVLLLLSGLMCSFAGAQTADTVIRDLISELTLNFKTDHPDLVLKPGVAVIPIVDDSPNAKRYEVGPALTAIAESNMQRSLIFSVVNDQLREKQIEEIKFALSGLADSDGPKPGQIKAVDYFLAGQITEIGMNFRLSYRLVDVETGEVLYAVDGEIPTNEVIQTSEAYTTAYVSPYGIGIEFSSLLWNYIYGQTADIEGQTVRGDTVFFQLGVNYRIRKWLVAWGGLELSPGAVRFEESFSSSTVYTETDFSNMTGLPPGSYGYEKDRSPFFSLIAGTGYVFNINKLFNVTLGAEISMTQTFLVQKFLVPPEGETEPVSHLVTSNDISMLSVAPKARFQYFITPRVAANLDYVFRYQFAEDKAGVFYFRDSAYSEGSPITDLYDLNPEVDPAGREHFTDLTGHRISLGIGLFF